MTSTLRPPLVREAEPLTPAAADRPRGLRLWLAAVRPKTLTISLVPVLVGTALAWAESGQAKLVAALVAAVAALLIQAATNLHNDAADFLRGGDTAIRPGPKRVTAEGWATPAEVIRAARWCFAMAGLCGIYIILVGGWPLLVLGAASLLAGWSYTGGPRPIAYTPFGEVFVLLFFGLGAVGGTYWLNAHALSSAALVAGTGVGILASAVLLVNNYRDRENDRLVGRRTLPLTLGLRASKAVFLGCLALPFILLGPLAAMLDSAAPLLALLAAPAAVPLARDFLTCPPGPGFNQVMAGTARLQVLYGLLLAAGLGAQGW